MWRRWQPGAGRDSGIQDAPSIGMVKDDRHRTRAIAQSTAGRSPSPATSSAFTLVSAIQEEVHRYSISYLPVQKHRKSGLESVLTGIPGIGKTRAAALYRHFKTVKAISAASEEDSGGSSGYDPSRRGSGVRVFPSGGKCSGMNVGRVRHG